MSNSEIEVWRAEAEAIPEEKARLGMPMSVLTSEAVNVAAFVKERWEPETDATTGQVKTPGLKQAQKKHEKGIALKKSLENDILSLQKAVQEAQVLFLLKARGSRGSSTVAERGVFVLAELKNSLEWLLDDGVENEDDEALANVVAEHADDGDNLDDLAQALDDFGALAATHRDGLAELGTFDVALIDEARQLASDLRQPELRGGDKDALRAAVAARLLRDQLAVLLQQRINRVRAAARHVFRHHPKILREVTSSYQRTRRAAARRKQATPTEG
jgi:hypothetical protein